MLSSFGCSLFRALGCLVDLITPTGWTRTRLNTMCLILEVLEDRTIPANTCYWIGGQNGNKFSDPANWDRRVAPTMKDDIAVFSIWDSKKNPIFNIKDAVIDKEVKIARIEIRSSWTKTIDLQANVEVADFRQFDGTVTGDKNLSIKSEFYWVGGNLEGNGTTLVGPGGVANDAHIFVKGDEKEVDLVLNRSLNFSLSEGVLLVLLCDFSLAGA